VIVWRDVFLGVIAVATLAIAIAQIVVIVSAAATVKRADQLADQFEREVKPLFGHLNAIARDAARAAQLASVQVERADKLFADLSVRLEETMNLVQASVIAPAREGRALLSAMRAAFEAVREMRQARARQTRSEDEDALFI
jgi:uncharacterized protein YoxC